MWCQDKTYLLQSLQAFAMLLENIFSIITEQVCTIQVCELCLNLALTVKYNDFRLRPSITARMSKKTKGRDFIETKSTLHREQNLIYFVFRKPVVK